MFAHGGFRDSVLGMYTKDANIQLIHYDRSAVIVSGPIIIDKSVEDLVCTLDVLANSKWGLCDIIPPLTNVPPPEDNRLPNLNLFLNVKLSVEDLQFTLRQTLFHQHGIIGRGSCVVKATVSSAPPHPIAREGTVCVVKLSWPPKTRASESDLIEEAHELAREEGSECISENLPTIYFTKDLQTTNTHDRLAKFFEDYERRVHRIVVMDELYPLSDLTKPAELEKVFRDIFKCE